MGFNRFSVLLTLRLFFIMLSLVALGYLIVIPDYHASTVLVFCVLATQVYEVFMFVSKTNQEIARFFDAARYADFGQRFSLGSLGAGFGELGDTFTDILNQFQKERRNKEVEFRHLKTLLEQVPVPLISIHADKHISIWNNAARRLFGLNQIINTNDLKLFGNEFKEAVEELRAGDKRLVKFTNDGMEQRLSLSLTEIIVSGKNERLLTLVNIQSELDGTQLDAWQDLVRVLTHEIMNSITPVASLAQTAGDLVEDLRAQQNLDELTRAALRDIQDAVDTLTRRSDGLIRFVSSYRQMTKQAPPVKRSFRLDMLFGDVARIAAQGWEQKDIILQSSIDPSELDLYADRELVEQVIINIIKNCEQAMVGRSCSRVNLSAKLNKQGHVAIEISDNGPGIAKEKRRKVFVPFYTTKREGSGVGLAFSRQVMIAHGGSINVVNNDEGGACFTLVF